MAASTIAASGSTRPGAMSRSAASRSRASHNARTAASARGLRTRCMPEVRRHGSARGAGGGAVRTASNSWRAHSSLPCSASSAGEDVAQRRRAPRRPARRRRASPRAAGGATSRPRRAPSPARARAAAPPSGRARPAAARRAARPARCRTASRARARPRPGTAGPGWRRAAPTPARSSAGASARQVAAQRDRVDERSAGARAAQLHQVGALRVAEARGPFGVDGDRSGARGERLRLRASAAGSATTGGSPSAGRSSGVPVAGVGAELSDVCVSVSG